VTINYLSLFVGYVFEYLKLESYYWIDYLKIFLPPLTSASCFAEGLAVDDVLLHLTLPKAVSACSIEIYAECFLIILIICLII
jgi:hypothetical protein